MGQLRDFFAAVGLCESTETLAKRPALIDKMIDQSMHYADRQDQFEQDSPYEDRLRQVLDCAYYSDLQTLVDHNVIVCLDHRLDHQNTGFWSTTMKSLFYDLGDQKVLAIRNNGKIRPRLFDSDNFSHLTSLFSKTVQDLLEWQNNYDLRVGYVAGSKTKYFTWDNGRGFGYELEQNPDLRTPPIDDGSLNAPEFYKKPAPQPGPHPSKQGPEQGPLGPF